MGVHCILDINPVKQENINKVDLYYDILFDKSFAGGLTNEIVCESKLARIYKNHLININYGKGILILVIKLRKNNC